MGESEGSENFVSAGRGSWRIHESANTRLTDFGILHGPLLAVLTPASENLFEQALTFHGRHEASNCLSVIVPPAEAPPLGARDDGRVIAFIATGEWATSIAGKGADRDDLCFEALSMALGDNEWEVAIQVVSGAPKVLSAPSAPTIEAIVPHKGKLTHLRRSLAGLISQTCDCKITLCLDQAIDRETEGLLSRQPRVDAWGVATPPLGPYVIRQYFASKTDCDFIAFQDSDDFSLPDRLTALTDHALRTDADIVGCHELRLDEITRCVRAVRFPLDVSAALSVIARHPQLFPTTVVKASYFKRCGGLSTTGTFGLDAEYLLRAYFSARIRNVDRFLYIRRRRPDSLTTTPETAMYSPIRVALRSRWKGDFEAIKQNKLTLAESAIALRHGEQFLEFSPIDLNQKRSFEAA